MRNRFSLNKHSGFSQSSQNQKLFEMVSYNQKRVYNDRLNWLFGFRNLKDLILKKII
jgi:hypothetical protein